MARTKIESGGSDTPNAAPIGALAGPELNDRRLAAIVEGSDDAIIGRTLEGTITSWNAGAVRMFGFAASIVGQPITCLIPDEMRAEEQAVIAALARGERVGPFHTMRIAEDGRRVPVSVAVSPIRDAEGIVVGLSEIARDAADRNQVEAASRGAIEEAQRARAEAERANREKTDFLAVMSHEIRTPMTGIAGFVELLSRSGGLTPEQRRYIGFVETANAALLTIVNEILDFSKVEAGRLDLRPRPLCIASLIYEATAITHPAAAEKNIMLRYNVDMNVPDWVSGDEARLRQVLLNLLGNAVKSTEAGSISVNVQSQRSVDGRERVLFSVADTGVGIPTQQQDRLFRKFSQAENSDRLQGGTGLGLLICKRLVDLMEGEIGVISDVGQGTTIWFTAVLPSTAAPASEAPTEPAHEEVRRQKGRILVVDDVGANLEIVSHFLRDDGYRVEPCDNAADAIELLKTAPFDLVLMDIQMPVIDGMAATRLIRAMGSPIGDIPIIALTGNVLPQQVRSFLDAGMNDHVSKPIERAHLYNTIGVWLSSPNIAAAALQASKPDFNRVKFDELMANFGSAWIEENAGKFVSLLEGCFEASSGAARREAHQILNFAGLLGLERLVELCRDLESAPEDAPMDQLHKFNQIRRAQATALETLRDVVIPEAHGRFVAGAYSRRPAKNMAAA